MPQHLRKLSLICCTLALLFGTPAASEAQEPANEVMQVGLMDYVETIYDESNGMITSEANTVLQDSTGYIWIGSYGGLVRYNGHDFENMSETRENAPKTGIRVLFQDSSDRIWIGTNDAGVYLFEDEAFRHIAETAPDFPIDAATLSVRSIAQGTDGTMYLGTVNGLATVGADMRLSMFQDERIEGEGVENLLCDANGAVWGTTGTSCIFVILNGEVVSFLDSDFLGQNLAYGLYQAKDGAVYIGTETNYVMRLRLTGDGYAKEDIAVELLTMDSRETVNDICQDSEGKLWICTDSGLGYLDENDTFYKINGLSCNTIISQMYEDYEGNLWFASSRRGVIRLTKNKFKHIGYEAGIDDETVNTTAICSGCLYIGTDSGLKIVDREGVSVESGLTEAMEGIRICGMETDSSNRLWIATYKEYGLVCYDPAADKWTSYTQKEGLAHDQVRMACELSNGDIAAATNGGVSIIRDGKVLRSYTEEDGIQNEVILCLAQGKDDVLYAGSDGSGIYAIDLETDEVENITVEDGLASGVILRIVPDDTVDGMWICNGSKVSLWRPGGIETMADINAGVGSVFDIKLSGDDLWLLKSFGLIRISREDFIEGNQNYDLLIRKDGFTSSVTANSWNAFTEDGLLLVSASNGVYCIDVNDIQRNTIPPKVSVGSIEVDDEIYYGAHDLELPSNAHRITLTLDLLSYMMGGGSLTYYMEGFDAEPIEVRSTSANYVNYTNLPGGSYTFHLTGYNADGMESEEVTFSINKKQNFLEQQYLHIWITMAAMLAASLLVILALYLNRRRIKKREEEYKMMVDRTVRIFAKTIDAKDKYTNGHSHRVAAYAVEIGRRYGLSKDDQERLYYGALLHDIGKIGVPDNILNKKSRLTDEEFECIKQHPTTGGNILDDFKDTMVWIPQVARYHHERYDGKGYNEGLKGEEIPLFARIVSVADSFDAMNSTRIYRPAMTEEVIREELRKGENLQFDAKFAEIMIEMMDEHFVVED